MAISRDHYYFTAGDYTVLWCHPRMPKGAMWKGSHEFDLCLRTILKRMLGRNEIEVFDCDVEMEPRTTQKAILAKIEQIHPNLIMFFDEFAQWNVKVLHAIGKNKNINDNSYQIFSYPTLSLIRSNFASQRSHHD